MPVNIVSGYPCSNCGCQSVDKRTDCTYFWMDFGIALAEEITNYICRNCKSILIQVIDHKQEKWDQKHHRKRGLKLYGITTHNFGDKVPILPKQHNWTISGLRAKKSRKLFRGTHNHNNLYLFKVSDYSSPGSK